MPKLSAGILLYRKAPSGLEFLLVHPGGPFYTHKDLGHWSIPKGEFEEGDDPLEVAKREFKEETGREINGKFIPLPPQKLKSGKRIQAWAVEGDFDVTTFKSNHFELEWPPKSGKIQSFPEVDQAEWFPTEMALKKIHPGQAGFIEAAAAAIPT
jgi:predicted NUDIX family NTP pyrophosphohydrolase